VNIYLCGMIGSGKTAVGKVIAKRLRWAFFDLDRVMESEAGKRIHDIVAEETWVGFRQREYDICKRFSKMDRSVIALGGGTIRYAWNRDVLKGSGMIVLLTASLRVLADRVRRQDRPRVNPGTSLEADIAILWKRYRHLYYGGADLTYRTDQSRTVKQEAGEIIEKIKKRGFFPRRQRKKSRARPGEDEPFGSFKS